MTIREARKIYHAFEDNQNPTDDDFFVYTEAMNYLIEQTGESEYMLNLGAHYYIRQIYDLAVKYYEMAADKGNLYAISNLGYVWYYGRTGEKNYKKAYEYYKKAWDMGDNDAGYKIADMYKNGYYLEQSDEKSKEILEKLFLKLHDADDLGEPVPEVFQRLAKLRVEEGDTEEAINMLYYAKDFLAQRCMARPFFGNQVVMNYIIDDLYQLVEFDEDDFDIYDLYELMKKPAKVRFRYRDTMYEIESSEEDGLMAIRFGEQWYKSLQDAFLKAEIDGKLLTMIWRDLYDYEVVR